MRLSHEERDLIVTALDFYRLEYLANTTSLTPERLEFEEALVERLTDKILLEGEGES